MIDADALLKQIADDSRGKEGWYGDTWEFINTIKDAPTIDAVTVVRCKDCKCWVPEQCTGESKTGICKDKCALKRFDGYCFHGERRRDETD